MNYIERDVYVLENRIKEKIDYVRGTNALPIYFHFRDYEIPEGATAKAFVLKPSKKATYNVCPMIHYRVSVWNNKNFYADQVDTLKASGMDGFAGDKYRFIDKFQAWIE